MLDVRIIQYQESRNQYPIYFGSGLSGLGFSERVHGWVKGWVKSEWVKKLIGTN